MRFERGGPEYDVISEQYVAQTKPAGYTLNKVGRDQFRRTFAEAGARDLTPYFHFAGQPQSGVLEKLHEYEGRYGISAVIDISPLHGERNG